MEPIEIVADIKRVAKRLGVSRLARSQYLQNNDGKFSMYDLYDSGHTWEEYCSRAGVRTKAVKSVPDETYFSRLKFAVAKLGRPPKTSERKKYLLNFSKRRWPTLEAFLREAMAKGIIQGPPTIGSRTSEKATTMLAADSAPQEPKLRQTRARSVAPIPRRTRRKKWERIGIDGFPYAPQDELGVVAIFAILCANGTISWQITELNGGKGIDGTCYDEGKARDVRVEFKRVLLRHSWNHSVDELDCVVCWENRWPDFPKQVIELRKLVKSLS